MIIRIKDFKMINEKYPNGWDLNTFKKLNTFKSRIEYCDKYLQKINSGSGRIVYKIDNDKVLKLAKNIKGIAQNSTEIQ